MTEREDITTARTRDGRHLEPLAWAESDESVAVRAAADPGAMTELYRRYIARVARYCRRRLQDPDLAEDVTSQIFLKVLEGLRKRRVENVASWIFTIAHNEVVSQYRRQRELIGITETVLALGDDDQLEETIITQVVAGDLRAMLSRLSADQQRVLELRLAGLTSREIRQVLGRSQTWIGTTEYRAVHRLRDLMTSNYPGEER
ncbi:MAG TPA: sigma-70 family RNA polymerase sigma factor [Thermomicrobiales bacterium]|jgi:RNA polymerase sigma-70 factor (ECF subfamily)|nr:sigma-70 family RNA polymerase sigma factor [Thermomicrobiales bacterium]